MARDAPIICRRVAGRGDSAGSAVHAGVGAETGCRRRRDRPCGVWPNRRRPRPAHPIRRYLIGRDSPPRRPRRRVAAPSRAVSAEVDRDTAGRAMRGKRATEPGNCVSGTAPIIRPTRSHPNPTCCPPSVAAGHLRLGHSLAGLLGFSVAIADIRPADASIRLIFAPGRDLLRYFPEAHVFAHQWSIGSCCARFSWAIDAIHKGLKDASRRSHLSDVNIAIFGLV